MLTCHLSEYMLNMILAAYADALDMLMADTKHRAAADNIKLPVLPEEFQHSYNIGELMKLVEKIRVLPT